jgi:hypothetical protein
MSGSIIATPAYKAQDWQSFATQVEKQRLGFIALSLTNYDSNSEPQIAAGSVVEISGSLFKFDSNDSIGGTPTTGQMNYIMLEVSGSGDEQTASGSWTTTAPTWNDGKQGWYEATGNKRYVAGCCYDGTNYRHKFLFDRGRDILRKFVIEIGDWNMDSAPSAAVNHYFPDPEKIRSIDCIIRNDPEFSGYIYPLVKTNQTDPDGGIGGVNPTQINLQRLTGGYFDSTAFDQTSYNRGWVMIEVEIV